MKPNQPYKPQITANKNKRAKCKAARFLCFLLGVALTALCFFAYDYKDAIRSFFVERFNKPAESIEEVVDVEPAVRVIAADAITFEDLKWAHGTFNASNAELTDGRIANGHFSYDEVRLTWFYGDYGPFDDSYVCLFYQASDMSWRGGVIAEVFTDEPNKQIAVTLKSEDGWPLDDVRYAAEYALVLISKDGAKRTNVIMAYP